MASKNGLATFVFRERFWQLLIAAAAIVIGAILVTRFEAAASGPLEYASHVIDCFVLFSVLTWCSEAKLEWINSLPQLLNVYIRHKDRTVFAAREIVLAGESDIRAWAQQVARQMNLERNLQFHPYIAQGFLQRKRVDKYGWVRLYEVVFELTAVPGQVVEPRRPEKPLDDESRGEYEAQLKKYEEELLEHKRKIDKYGAGWIGDLNRVLVSHAGPREKADIPLSEMTLLWVEGPQGTAIRSVEPAESLQPRLP